MTRPEPGTPLPWDIKQREMNDNTLPIGDGSKASPLAYVSPRPFYDPGEQEANAAYIVHACNALPSLEAENKLLKEENKTLKAKLLGYTGS